MTWFVILTPTPPALLQLQDLRARRPMDRSLDDIIKDTRKQEKNPFSAGASNGSAPGGKKGKGKKGAPDKKAQLVKATNQSSKAKRASKVAANRGMDVDMTPAPNVFAKSRGKSQPGKKGGVKTKAKNAVGKAMNTLKARMAAKPGGASQPAKVSAKAADIKITIPGQVGKAPPKQKGGVIKPGQQSARANTNGKGAGKLKRPGTIASAIKKGNQQKQMRMITVGGNGRGRGGGASGAGRGRGRGLLARAGRA